MKLKIFDLTYVEQSYWKNFRLSLGLKDQPAEELVKYGAELIRVEGNYHIAFKNDQDATLFLMRFS